MKQTTGELTTDLSRIGAQLSQTIRGDHKRYQRRRSLVRTVTDRDRKPFGTLWHRARRR